LCTQKQFDTSVIAGFHSIFHPNCALLPQSYTIKTQTIWSSMYHSMYHEHWCCCRCL